jgi:hypothetical protein
MGVFAGCTVGKLFPLVLAVAKFNGADGVAHGVMAQEALYNHNGMDNLVVCACNINGNLGKQAAQSGNVIIPFHFNRSKHLSWKSFQLQLVS